MAAASMDSPIRQPSATKGSPPPDARRSGLSADLARRVLWDGKTRFFRKQPASIDGWKRRSDLYNNDRNWARRRRCASVKRHFLGGKLPHCCAVSTACSRAVATSN